MPKTYTDLMIEQIQILSLHTQQCENLDLRFVHDHATAVVQLCSQVERARDAEASNAAAKPILRIA